MAKVRISWDDGEPVEYECGHEWMQGLASTINYCVKEGGLVIVSKGAGELQYAAELQEDPSLSVSQGHRDQGTQLDLEDAINEKEE